ncbi:sensor histidine kinase [Oerskovia flava]|uniref:sensor histidine kinase n=1 Tax=Oerskovia flava TaxID=2986422 RepID=UPI0022407BD7|nr:nitrate- and nitrite sensing domain-containing protein [Oerskovia sp. JB1-3-2]
MSVRGKILAALAVPVLVLFVAAAIISAQAINDARVANQVSSLVEALAVQDTAGRALAAERGASMLAASNVDGADDLVVEARAATDQALAQRDRRFRDLDTSALDARVGEALDRTLADVDELDVLRTQIDNRSSLELASTQRYSEFITNALRVQELLAETSGNREVAQYLTTYTSVNLMMDQLALERPFYGLLMASAQRGQLTPTSSLRGATTVVRGYELNNDARLAVEALRLEDARLPLPPASYTTVRTNIGSQAPQAVPATNRDAWDETATEYLNEVTPVRDTIRQASVERVSEVASAEVTRTALTIIFTLLAVVASVVIAGLISRGIVNPLRRLTSAAADVRQELPKLVEQVAVPGQGPGISLAPITVESNDEVGQLAAAFNDVNTTTIQVAREQAALRGSIAEMFVNVARRDQVLLNRQLAFLDDLERSEEDPNTLSNLFRLDHLATRMRRNAESLLVLAGIDSGRRVRQPMPASDVIRTASSEIELYDRVRLNLAIDPLMLGHNALNAAHLIAELLENATMFSEPHTPVEVSTARDDRYVKVVVRDHGLGMTAEEIVDANRKVATHAASEIVGAQRLGLYVVGRLAERLGANVVFTAGSDGTGTEVTVNFPAALFVPDSNVPLPQPTDPLETATQSAVQQRGAAPAPAPAPVAGPPTATTPVVEPEAPVAVPVDLDALTDGTTQTGMPRRRSRGVDPAGSAPSASFAQGPQTGAIVLPPLATPSLPADLPVADDAWTPPEDVTPADPALPNRALPSRRRPAEADSAAAPTLPPAPESSEIPVLDVSTRSALFSSFRSLADLDAPAANPVELEAAPEVGASDIVVPDFVPDSDSWAPTFSIGSGGPLGQGADPATAHGEGSGDASVEPDQYPATQPLDDDTRTMEPVAPSPEGSQQESYEPQAYAPEAYVPTENAHAAPQAEQAGWQPAEQVGWQPEQAPGGYDDLVSGVPDTAAYDADASPREQAAPTATPAQGVPHAQQSSVPEVAHETAAPQEPAREEIPEELTFEALPKFEELMADLPTRRSLRESATRKRGLFGRRARPVATRTEPGAPPATVTPRPPAGQPYAPQAPVQQPSAPQAPAAAAPAAQAPTAGPARASAFSTAPRTFAPPTEAYSPQFAPPDTPADVPAAPVERSAQTPAPASNGQPWEPRRPGSVGQQQPNPYDAFLGSGGSGNADAATRAPAAAPAEPGAPAPDLAGGSAPLARRQPRDGLQPLDPTYVSDSVEARSDWMASAVLYEEMSTLLSSTDDLQDSTLGDQNHSYRPETIATAGGGLARRARSGPSDDYVDRFTARIDRDPEQLRARLAAYQSATARGRVEAGDETGSTWDTQTVDHVPDSAPQSR